MANKKSKHISEEQRLKNSESTMKWRLKNLDRYRAYQLEYHRKYNKTIKQKEYRKEYEQRPARVERRQTVAYKQYHDEYNKKQRIKNKKNKKSNS